MPQAESGPRSPNRRLSKIPSAASLQPEASTAQGLTRTLSLNSNRKNADEAMGRMVAKNNMANIKGRTLVELQQARAGGRPMSAVVLPTTGENVSPKRAFRDRIGLERKSSGDEPVAVWDPERDEMPSPFLVRARRIARV
jgi:NIMA (never in mitosis gene a)-related kinase